MCIEDDIDNTLKPDEYFKLGYKIGQISEITSLNRQEVITKIEKDLVDKLKELLLSKRTVVDISKYLELSRKTVYNLIKKHELEKYRLKKGYTKAVVDKNKLMFDYLKLNGLVTVSELQKMDHKTAKKHLESLGFKIPSSGLMYKVTKHITKEGKLEYYNPITEKLLEVFRGQLLGDAQVRINIPRKDGEKTVENIPKKTPSLGNYKNAADFFLKMKGLKDIKELKHKNLTINKFNQSIETLGKMPTSYFRMHIRVEDEKWLREVGKILTENNYPVKIFKSISKDKDGNEKESIYLDSKSSVQLQKIYEKWYVNNKKIVPDDFKLTPRIVRHWFAGDGSNDKSSISLYTDGFKEEEVSKLVDKLNKEIEINASYYTITKPENPDKEYHRIRFTHRDNFKKFYDYMEKDKSETHNILKETMPWKFDPDLLKRDVEKKK